MTLITGALAPLADCCNHGWGGGWFVFPLFWIALIVFLVFVFRRRGPWRGGYRRFHHTPTAAELLEGRFARGEIDDDEYRRRRSVLGDDGEQR